MNSKDIASFRRQLKIENDRLKIFDVFNVYIMKESDEIYHHECHPFAMLEREQQELFMGNFKKLLTGRMDEKLFELKFRSDAEDPSQLILHKGLLASEVEQWKEEMLRIVSKMLSEDTFEQDTVITFSRGKYFKPMKKQDVMEEDSERNEIYAFSFILCSINKTEQPQKTLVFDYVSKEFKYNIAVDPIIKLASPEGGFLFPAIRDDAADVNHVLYSVAKANQPDPFFIDQVLNGELASTAKEDKSYFEQIVGEVTGGELEPSTLSQVYEKIHLFVEEAKEEEEAPVLDARIVEQMLVASGVEQADTERVTQAFEDVVDDAKYEIKASSVLPKYSSKSIKINTDMATISISPENLKFLKQVNYKGKRCLLIEVDEEMVIEGLTMKVEEL